MTNYGQAVVERASMVDRELERGVTLGDAAKRVGGPPRTFRCRSPRLILS